jgi:hypothetical protein
MDDPPPGFEGLASLDDRERFDWLRLLRCQNIGPRTFRVLLERYGSAGAALAALAALPALIASGKAGRPIRIATVDERARGRGDASGGSAFCWDWRTRLSGAPAAHPFAAARDCCAGQYFEPPPVQNRDRRRPQRFGGRTRLHGPVRARNRPFRACHRLRPNSVSHCPCLSSNPLKYQLVALPLVFPCACLFAIIRVEL